MPLDVSATMRILLAVAFFASSEAFFMKWTSDNPQPPKWIQPIPNIIPNYRAYSYPYSPFEHRKLYQLPPQYQPEPMAPIPISVPAGSNLTPISLQHVQLVPCMCPVAPEEADKLQESVGPGPYIAQTISSGYGGQPDQPKH